MRCAEGRISIQLLICFYLLFHFKTRHVFLLHSVHTTVIPKCTTEKKFWEELIDAYLAANASVYLARRATFVN
jgi:hypothetical protein